MNQKEAAELLGWTRGALCQYLNGHTKISAEVLIKLANFFEVDPRELDPAIEQFLPKINKLPVIHESNNPELIKDQSMTSVGSAAMKEMGGCVIRVTHPLSWKTDSGWNTVVDGFLICLKRPNRSLVDDDSLWVVLKKDETAFQVFRQTAMPLANQIAKKFLLRSVKWVE